MLVQKSVKQRSRKNTSDFRSSSTRKGIKPIEGWIASTVNKKIKPIAKRPGVLKSIEPPHKVASQLNILIPVGIAIIMVAAVKYPLVSMYRPTVNMWRGPTQ